MLYGVVTSGEFCTVTRNDKADDLDESDARNLGTLNFKVLSAMDMVLANFKSAKQGTRKRRLDLR